MSQNHLHPARWGFHILLMFVLTVLSMQTHAQMQPSTAANNPAAQAGGSIPAGLSAMGAPSAGAMGLVQPPVLPPRPDLGAQDAQRNALTPLRAPKPQTPGQFQRFVQESTGKLLPHFGAQLFENPLAYAADAAAPAPGEYVLGPGDEIRIQIWGAIDYAGNQTLDRNGQISLPKIGAISLHGVQVKDLDATLRKQVNTVFTNVTVNASLGKLRGITVYVVGQAQQPGTYNLNSLSTLVNAVFASGGPDANGSMRSIELKRNGKTVTTLDLYDFISKGDKSKDAPLQPGDVIMIPPAGPRVALTGATDHGAVYEIKARTTVQDVLALAGGLSALASTHKALIESIGTDIKAPRQVQDIVLNAQGLGRSLKDGDIITLLPISPAFGNAVTLRGNVASPLRHAFKPGMRVADLVPETDALILPDYYTRKNGMVQLASGRNVSGDKVVSDVKKQLAEINWDYASIERLDPQAVKTTLIPFNLGKAIKDKDPDNNIELMAGDVVTIFGVDDIPVPLEKRTQFVRVGGEVKIPGIYQITPGETLPQLVQRAGGLSRDAYMYGTVFTRESTRAQQQENLNQAIRRMESQVSAQSATTVQNVYDADSVNNAKVRVESQRMVLDRLRNLKASGRIALEMEADRPELPALSLQDGDSITVPTKPSFVAVFGAVMAENSFIHRANSTVGDYIDKAGPTREADLEAAMLIRGDGTVLSNRAQRSWIGLGNMGFMGTRLQPGDSIFIPELLDRRSAYTQFIQGAKDWTAILYQFGIGAAALKTLKN